MIKTVAPPIHLPLKKAFDFPGEEIREPELYPVPLFQFKP